MGAIAEGMAWGVGSAVGHRAIDSMFGPRQVAASHTMNFLFCAAIRDTNEKY